MKTGAETESLGHWSIDPLTMELRASAACKRNHGCQPREDSTYEQIVASIHPDDRDRVRRAFRRALEEGEDYEEQYRVILPSKEVRNILARGRLQQPSNGGAPQLAGTTLDVTGGASGLEEPGRAILEAAGEGIYGLDPRGRVTFANPAAQRMAGLGAEEIVGRLMHEEVHHSRPDGSPYPAKECPIYETLRDGAVRHAENEVFWRADGESFTVSYTATPIIEEGEVAGAVVTFSENAARKRSEEELREREERLRLAMEAAELGIWELDLRTNASPARSEHHDRIFGYEEPVESWNVETFLDHVHPGDRQRIRQSFEEALRTGAWEFECRILRANDGEQRWITAQGKFYFEGGEPRRAVGTVRDITRSKQAEEALGEAEQRYRTLFESMDEGYAVVEALTDDNGVWSDFLLIEVNPAFEQHTGLIDPIGRTGSELLGDPDPGWARICGRVAQTGEPERVEQKEETLGRIFDLYAFRLGGADSRRVAVLFTDVTERKRVEAEREQARQRTAFLSEASRRLAESLDYEQTLSEIARLAVPAMADLCIVDTLAAPGEGSSSVRRLAAAHHDPEKEQLAWELEERYPVSEDRKSAIAGVIRTARPVLLTEVSDDWLEYMAQDEDHRQLLERLDLGSMVIVALTTHGRTLGALTLAFDGSGRRYGDEDLYLAQDLARRAAQSMDNARLYAEQSHAARTLQQSLLPPSLPEIPGIQSAARHRPATSHAGSAAGGYNVGGDFYDLFQTSSGWAAVIGDVMGKGVEAAELTAMVRYTLRTAAMSGDSPSSVVSTLNAAMLNQRSDLRFCTLAYGLLNEPREGAARLALCRGGHPAPLILRAGGAVEEAGARGLLVGVESDTSWSDTFVELAAGDSLIFYTDGLTEARNPEGRMFGEKRLGDLAASCCSLGAEEIAAALETGVREFQAGENSRDDVALLVIRATGRDEPV